ncbi:MAG: folate family ECF transporter S component [Christensenellales bacterium]
MERTNQALSNPLKKTMVMALMVALSIVLERFLGYNDRVLSVSFSYLPIALTGMLFGPIPAAAVSGLADALGALMFPSGPFDIRFTLIALVKGALYGVFLYGVQGNRYRIILAQVLVTLIAHLTLNTLVISTIIGKGFFVILPLRLVKNLLFLPIEVLTLIKMYDYRTAFERMVK